MTTSNKRPLLFVFSVVAYRRFDFKIWRCYNLTLVFTLHLTARSPQQMDEETTFPCTPTTAHQQNSGFVPTSEATNSPFNFEIHSNFIQQLTKSPGDGFLFQSRPMFDNSMEGDKEQVSWLTITLISLFYNSLAWSKPLRPQRAGLQAITCNSLSFVLINTNRKKKLMQGVH